MMLINPPEGAGLFAKLKLSGNRGKHKKIVAVALAVTLGTFGVHRLYMGTAPRVPVIYACTLGGGMGILPLSDAVAVLIVSDVEKYADNDKIIMWIK